jgi:hypothetical protein
VIIMVDRSDTDAVPWCESCDMRPARWRVTADGVPFAVCDGCAEGADVAASVTRERIEATGHASGH